MVSSGEARGTGPAAMAGRASARRTAKLVILRARIDCTPPGQCPDSEVREHSQRPPSELQNRKDTGNSMMLVPLLNPKSAITPAEKSCELRVRGTSENSDLLPLVGNSRHFGIRGVSRVL